MTLITDLDAKGFHGIQQPKLQHKFRIIATSDALTEDDTKQLCIQTVKIRSRASIDTISRLLSKEPDSEVFHTLKWSIESDILSKIDYAVLKLCKDDVKFTVLVQYLDGDCTSLLETTYYYCEVDNVTTKLDYAVSETVKYKITFNSPKAEHHYPFNEEDIKKMEEPHKFEEDENIKLRD